jgi:predicted component of type VI protein secretion system
MTRDDNIPMIIAQSGPASGQRWALTKERHVIGREPDCDIVIPDRQVSRAHAVLVRVEDGYEVEDLSSKNGTHINGKPLEGRVRLQDGDLIQVALVARLAFVGSDATMPLRADSPLAAMLAGAEASAAESAAAAPLDDKRLRMDNASRRVWAGGVEIDPPLSGPQFRFLELLYENPGKVVTRETIIDSVWAQSAEEGVSEQAIDALVRRVRDRLVEADPEHQYITTVRGHGFRFDNPKTP